MAIHTARDAVEAAAAVALTTTTMMLTQTEASLHNRLPSAPNAIQPACRVTDRYTVTICYR